MKLHILLPLVLLGLVLCGCAKRSASVEVPAPPAAPPALQDEISQEAPLICTAETQEEAEAIAARYDITLVEFADGVASFYTEKDPRALIRMGQEQGWPPLELNRVIRLDDPVVKPFPVEKIP